MEKGRARFPMNRPSASQRGYDHRWRIRSKHFLQRNPLCRMCEKEGKLTVASVVDHIVPHKGDPGLFNDVRQLAGSVQAITTEPNSALTFMATALR